MSYEKNNEKEEERKGAAAPWMGQSAAVGSRGFIGSPAAGLRSFLMGLMHSRALLLVFAAAAAGYSSLGLLDMHDRGGFGVVSSKPGGTFFSPPMGAAPSSLPRPQSRGAASSLDMARQANQGALSENALGKDEPANASPDASADQGQSGAADAAAAAGADPGSAMADAAKAAAAAPRGGLTRLSGNLGGGSGAGSGASLSSGGSGAGGKAPGTDSSKMALAQNAAGARAKMPAGSRGSRFGKSSTLRRLADMRAAIKPTAGMGDNFAASDAQTKAWEGEKPNGAGVTGAGPSVPGVGAGPSSNEGMGPGGPVANNGSTYDPNSDTNVPDVGAGLNVTPYQGLVDLAVDLLMASALLTSFATILWLLGRGIPHLLGLAAVITKLAIAAALGAAACGVAIATINGQLLQGGIFAVFGGILAFLAWKSTLGDPTSAGIGAIVTHGATGFAALKLGEIGAGLGKVADKPGFGEGGTVGGIVNGIKTISGNVNAHAEETGWSLTHDHIEKATTKMDADVDLKKKAGGGAGGGGGGAN